MQRGSTELPVHTGLLLLFTLYNHFSHKYNTVKKHVHADETVYSLFSNTDVILVTEYGQQAKLPLIYMGK